MKIHHIILVAIGLCISFSAQADDYWTCRDNSDIAFQNLRHMISLAEEGSEPAQRRVAELDAQLHSTCLCKQTEWDRLNEEYTAALIEYSDGRHRVRLARPLVLSVQRPECPAPTARVWPTKADETTSTPDED